MGSSNLRIIRTRVICALALVSSVLAIPAASPAAAGSVSPAPIFTKAFNPNTIGPDSTSTLTFTIDNSANGPREDLAFTDILPSGMTIATPASATMTCPVSGPVGPTLSAPDGGTTISLSDASVGGGEICEVSVNVTAIANDNSNTNYTNISGALSYSDGIESGTTSGASADLLVDIGRPGFTKSFEPMSVVIGSRSTLTFTIDNSLNTGSASNIGFSDNLPAGMVVASPPNAATTCIVGDVTAVAGSNVVSLIGGSVFGDDTCTVSVDVIGDAVGSLENVSSELLSGSPAVSSGIATAALEVTGVSELIELVKEFTDDPVPPGGATTLEFSVTNKSRTDSATGITFDDELDNMLAGAAATLPPTPNPPCGAGSSLVFTTGVLTLTGGTLAPEATCTFSVAVNIPETATPGTYTNTAGPGSGTIGGSTETTNTANELLFVVAYPILTKEFTDDPVGAGATTTLEFTITNPASTAMTDINFVDEFDQIMQTSPSGAPANGFCGAGSTATFFPLTNPASGGGSPARLFVSGAELAPAGAAGDECTFSITLDVVAGAAGGVYPNTTEPIFGTVDTATVQGPPASDDLTVLGAPQLSKEFTDDPTLPGGTATLLFTLENLDADNPASAIAFSDDLDATLSGLVATSVPTDTCGGTPAGLTTGVFSYSGGTLAASATCTIEVIVTVPAIPGGIFDNVTSELTATVAGVATKSAPASDSLTVSGLVLSKEFTDDPVLAGGTVTLRFTLDNTAGTIDAADITFEDALDPDVLDGLTATVVPATPCGGSLVTLDPPGPTVEALKFVGGAVTAGTSCSFDVTLSVPPGTADDEYDNSTANAAATFGGPFVELANAFDTLTVDSNLLELTKEFTNDPVKPGDEVTLVFTLENLSATETVTDIGFDDDLDATLSGLEAVGANSNGCGGMAGVFPTGLFSYGGATLLPAAICTISIQVEVPAGSIPGNVFPNTTTGVSGKVGALDVYGDPASDDLEVQTLKLTKSFDGPILATRTAVITFTIENLDAANPAGQLAFSDDLGAALTGLAATTLPAGAPCGAGSTISGTTFLAVSNASVPAGGTCTFDVTVTAPTTAPDGSYVNSTSELFSAGIAVADAATAPFDVDVNPPTVTINQAAGQADPTNASPINYTVVFSETVTGFTDADITLTGTAGATTATVTSTGSPNTYNVAVTGMTSDGTVIATVNAAAATDTAGNGNTASTSTDNEVTYDTTAPTVTINQAAGQADPTNTSPINYTVVFNESVTGFTDADITLTGTAGATTATVTSTGSPNTYNVAVTGMTSDGTVIATVNAAAATDTAGNGNTASTSTDNEVTYDTTAPTVTINQAAGQADPTNTSPINYTVVFNGPVTGFTDADITLTGTAGATTATVTSTGSPNTYNVAVTGMTSDGTVIATVNAAAATDTAGNGNTASTSTDNEVTYDTTAPTVTINQAAGQADPTNASPINYTVVFNGPVTGFAADDITLTGTAGATTATVTSTGSPNTYNVAVTGMTSDGTVIATVNAAAATDTAGNGNTASTSTDNEVTYDTTDPVINPPGTTLTVNNDPGKAGATVNYVVTTTDEGTATAFLAARLATAEEAALVGPGGLVCAPPSGSFFPLGTTTVTCTATDLAGNTTTSTFSVVVIDNEDPVITNPGTINASIPTAPSGPVNFTPPTATDNSGAATVACTPTSGAVFNVGTTAVTCIATDPSNNTAQVTFNIRVTAPELPATGGDLGALDIAINVLLGGLVLLALSRMGSRRRLRAS